MATKLERQAAEYRRAMGQEATERQLATGRCTTCLGKLPYGHRYDCPWYGGRTPPPRP